MDRNLMMLQTDKNTMTCAEAGIGNLLGCGQNRALKKSRWNFPDGPLL
jgi:hypothetical protein